MAIQYHMRAWNGSAYVDWVVNDSPDLTGEFYPGGSAGLVNITINKKINSKMPNRIKPLNSVDGTILHINSYDWLKSTRTSSDTDSATDPVAVPTKNVGLAIVRGTADGYTPRDYASLHWDEGQNIFTLGFTTNDLESLSSTKPLISGHVNIVEGNEDGYLSILRNSKVPAADGAIRLPNNEPIMGRNNANSDNLYMLLLDTSDRVNVGSATTTAYVPSSLRIDNDVHFGSPTLAATTSFIRLPSNNNIMSVRNAANSDNILFLSSDSGDALLIGDEKNTNIKYNTVGQHEFRINDTYLLRLGIATNGYLSFDNDISNPTITQQNASAGNGQNMFLSAQTTSFDYGGTLILNSGEGSTGDGYVNISTGGDSKLRVYGATVPVVSDFPNLPAENPNSVVLFNDTLRFYDNGSGIDATIVYDASSSHVGNDMVIKGQDSSTSNGGVLRLESGTATGAGTHGDVSIWSGTVLKLLVNDPTSTTTTYNDNFDFDRTVSSPKIEHEYDATATGDDFVISAQVGDTTGGRLLIGSGDGGTQSGDVHIKTGLAEGLVITQDGYGFTRSHLPGIFFDAASVEDGYGVDKVLVSQEDDPTTNYIGTAMWMMAQSARDGYGGDLVLSSGMGKVPLKDDGDVIIRLGLTPVSSYYSVDGYTTNRIYSDIVQIDGDLLVNGTTTTINSTVVDIADRVIHVNHSTGANDPVPVNIAGLSVHRGASGGLNRDHAGVIWDESDNSGIWKFATVEDGYDLVLVSPQPVMAEYFLSQSSPDITELDVPTIGALRTINNTVAVSSRNAASSADLRLLGTDSSDNINYGFTNVTGHIFDVSVSGLYHFNFNAVESNKIGPEYMEFGANSSQSGNIRTGQTFQTAKSVVTARDISDSTDQLLLGVDGYGGVVHGDLQAAGHDIVSKDGYSIDIRVGSETLFTSTADKNIFHRGLRKDVAYVSENITITDADGYGYVAVNSAPGSLTVTLPASPSEGDTYEFKDMGHSDVNSWTLDGNGSNIDGVTSVLVFQPYVSMIITYIAGIENQWFVS